MVYTHYASIPSTPLNHFITNPSFMSAPNIRYISIQNPIIPPSSSFLHTPAPFPTTLRIHFQLYIHYLAIRDTISASPTLSLWPLNTHFPPFARSVLLTRPLIALISAMLPLSISLPLHPFTQAYYHPILLPYVKPNSRPFLLLRQTIISFSESMHFPAIPHPFSHAGIPVLSKKDAQQGLKTKNSVYDSSIDHFMELFTL